MIIDHYISIYNKYIILGFNIESTWPILTTYIYRFDSHKKKIFIQILLYLRKESLPLDQFYVKNNL